MRCLPLGLIALLFVACPRPTPPPDGGSDAGLPDAGDPGDGGFVWPVPTGPISITPHASWKNRLSVPNDPFAASSAGLRWVKFTVLMRDPTKVYFQDSNAYPLHAPFAVERLDPFFGMTIAQFEAVSLHEAGQEAITGAVLLAPLGNEVGVQLVRFDPYAKEMVKIVFDLVKSALDGPTELQSFYMPTFEQAASAEQHRAWLEANDVPLASPDRWLTGSVCYAPGWAIGKLVHVAPSDIDAAYADGRLTVNDVLLTEQVPAEVPPVAGIVTLAPATPNSHVAILATTLKIPFLYTPHAEQVAKLRALEGHQVVLSTSTRFSSACQLDVFAADGLSSTVRAELLALKVPPPINLPPKQVRGAFSANTDTLQPSDIAFFGGKASHYGLLRRAVPNESYPAVALSFDVWDDAMSRPVSTSRTLGAEIALRLAPISSWPPNLPVLKQTLAGIRKLIVDEASLSPAATAGVRAALTGFDPLRGIRFRSSTNVEDTAEFTGAGLYDSATGCLADDDDADTVGPSRCSPDKADERGVFLALRKVFASFYNDNAYLERLRHGVDESKVGMAVLVHYSVPDGDELANGVITHEEWTAQRTAKIVTQLGADSVTNPDGTSLPEVVAGWSSSTNWYFDLESGSSRVPLGSWVMSSPTDYEQLGALTTRVAAEYATLVARPFFLDFEFKKQVPGKLWLKQVRPLPVPSTTPSVVPFVLGRGERLCVSQSENSNVLSLHRLRLRLEPVIRDGRMTDAARAQSVLESASLAQFDGDTLQTLSGAPGGWPGFVHTQQGDALLDSFSFGSGATARTVELRLELPRLVAETAPPFLTTRDLAFSVHSTWSQPQPVIPPYPGAPTSTLEDDARLGTCPEDEVLTEGHLLQTRTFSGAGLTVDTRFYWPPAPTGIVAGYTAPLVKWGSTEISGLTTTPLRLTADFAQTYRPGHHNLTDSFLFDPFSEPAVTAAQRAELVTRNVKWLIVRDALSSPEFFAVGFDGALRSLP
ncbi:MAG: PEP/pyruvate-binding domain-containing protein [Myxococcota bacterium]